MRYVSVFSGIEAASVAWEPLGWEPVAFAEIDAFPSAVLAERYPDVPNLGDITKIDWKEFINEHGRPDVIVGGSPCQSFSIAGGRESLGGESRLMFEYIRAVQDLRPRWFLWENVPGVLNTRDNAFVQLLDSLQDLGYALAWRVLDAQFFGVAQRRRRVFLVGHLGDGGAPAAVLFESKSVSGNTQTSREKRQELAERATESAGTGGECLTQDSVLAFAQNTRDEVRLLGGDGSLTGALAAQSGAKQTTYVMTTANTNANGSNVSTDVAYTLDGTNCNAICMSSGQANAEVTDGGLAPTLTLLHEAPIVIDRAAFNQGGAALYAPHIEQSELMSTLVAKGPHAICAQT